MDQFSDNVYEELNELVNNNFQILVNKDRSPRELYRSNVSQTRRFTEFSEENALEIIEKTKDPLFILNNFTSGDITHI